MSVVSRPDIAFTVSVASRKHETLCASDWIALKRILRCLEGTSNVGISYVAEPGHGALNMFCDSDFAGDHVTRRSTAGYVPTSRSYRVVLSPCVIDVNLWSFSRQRRRSLLVIAKLTKRCCGSNLFAADFLTKGLYAIARCRMKSYADVREWECQD